MNLALGFNDLWLWLLGIPVVAALMPIAFFHIYPFDNSHNYLNQFYINLIFVTIYWHSDRLIVYYFRKKLPNYSQYLKRLIYQLASVYLFTTLFCLICSSFFDYAISLLIPNFVKLEYSLIIIASLVTTTLVLAIYESIYAINMWKVAILETEELKKENVKSQLETLKNQVNPHFLFNSLNTLAAIIPEDPALSVEFVEKLSKVYRHILEIKDKEIISLEEELGAAKAYIFLLKTRFGDNLVIDIQLNSKNKYIIPLSLQMLIENAIKHNVVSASKHLTIHIIEKENSLSVSNNLQLKSHVLDSTKTGLNNITKRYKLLVNKEVKINQTSNEFSVLLPLITID